jgi:hypothetical protein
MWRLAGMQRGSMMAKAARAAKPAALKASSIVPKLAHHSLPSFAVRAGALTVLSTFSAMATHSYNMNIFDEEVDMDFLEGNDDESVASAAEEPAVSAAAEREAEASEESEAEASEECAVSAGASEERAVSAAASEEREDGSQDGSQRGSQDGSWDGSQADGAFDDDDDFDDGVDDDFPEPSPEHVRTATLQVGKEAEHDLLGVGTVLARGTEEDNAGKILFKFVKKVKQGRSWVPQTVERWVFEDALTAVMCIMMVKAMFPLKLAPPGHRLLTRCKNMRAQPTPSHRACPHQSSLHTSVSAKQRQPERQLVRAAQIPLCARPRSQKSTLHFVLWSSQITR